MFYWKTREWWI